MTLQQQVEVTEFERWSGYEEQSWQQRFNTLDAEHRRLCKQMVDSAVSQAARITADRARIEQLERALRDIVSDSVSLEAAMLSARTALTSGRGG